MPTSPDIVAALIEGLHDAGLTNAEIARRSGISRANIYRLQNGAAREPHLSSYRALGRVYKNVLRRDPPLSDLLRR